METKAPGRSRLTWALGIGAIASAVLLAVMIVLSLPALKRDFAALLLPTETPTESPTDPPTEPPATDPPTEPEPTLPPPDSNPYGKLDFQYAGRFLALADGGSTTGIDVSSHQKEIDWEQVKASGVDFAIIRVGYRGYETGTIVEDKYAEANLEGAAQAGLEIGVYFFSQALTAEEALEEAEFVLNYIRDYEITMPVVFDWEQVQQMGSRSKGVDARTLTDCALAFLERIDEAGYWPMLYFNTYQSKNMLYLAELKQYDFWLAHYTDRMTFPYKLKMWQYTNTGSVPGIEGDTDINVFFKNT